jgi:hypothetical protein
MWLQDEPSVRTIVLAPAVRATIDNIMLVAMAAAFAMLITGVASAHEVRPAYLSVQQEAPNEFSVLFKTPMQGDARLALSASFSGKVENLTPVISHPTRRCDGADLALAHARAPGRPERADRWLAEHHDRYAGACGVCQRQ